MKEISVHFNVCVQSKYYPLHFLKTENTPKIGWVFQAGHYSNQLLKKQTEKKNRWFTWTSFEQLCQEYYFALEKIFSAVSVKFHGHNLN